MKNLFLTAITFLTFSLVMQAQGVADNAIGLRLGDSGGFGTEVNYQRGLNENNRLEFGLGWHSNNDVTVIKLAALYQWVWVLDGNFNWYVGAGGGVGQVDVNSGSETYVFAAGDIGIEYDFDIPLLLSLDFRPEFGFGNVRDDIDFDIALGIRYQF